MPVSPTGSLLAFHHVSIAVGDLPSAVADWEGALGWPASEGSRFGLADGYLELVAAGEGPVGVVEVAVVVNDVLALAADIERAGGTVVRHADGTVAVDRSSVSGVPLLLCPKGAAPTTPATGAFQRISHLVVAVSDLGEAVARWSGYLGAWPPKKEAGGEVSEHVPVGRAWFGLTAAGTNAEAIERFIARSGEGIYAVGLVVDDPAAVASELVARGARVIGDGTTPQTFIHPATTHGLLVALVA
jgi:methylmalonyl-CoA/ethylmalonyl-CoA epimerase